MGNNRPLGWTTLEEAKLLVNAGLDPNTADMSYNWVVCKVINGNASEDWLLQPFPPDENQPHKQLPCWSLGSLIDLMQKHLYDYSLRITFENDIPRVYYVNSKGKLLKLKENHPYYCPDGYIVCDSIVEMCIWRINKGYIKKSE